MTKVQKRYANFKRKGLCVRCGKRPPKKSEKRCIWCKAKVNKGRRAWRARKAAEKLAPAEAVTA